MVHTKWSRDVIFAINSGIDLIYESLVMTMFCYQITKMNECQKIHSNIHEKEQVIIPNNINLEWYSSQRQNKIPMNHVFSIDCKVPLQPKGFLLQEISVYIILVTMKLIFLVLSTLGCKVRVLIKKWFANWMPRNVIR